MPSLGPTELIVILVLALLLFGAGKLGDVGSAVGKSIREFRRTVSEEPPPPKPQSPPPSGDSNQRPPNPPSP